MTKAIIPVQGMSCAHCEARVTAAVEALAGVKACKASAKKAIIKVKFDPELTPADAIKAAVREAGFQA